MAAVQTSVAEAAIAFAGMLAQNDQGVRIDSRVYEDTAELPFGTMVIRGTDEESQAKQLHTSAAACEQLLAGVVVHSHIYAPDTELGTTGLKQYTTLNVLQRGRIYVLPEETVTPGDAVRVRAVVAGDEVKGAFRTTADSTDCIDISSFARWVKGGTTSVPAVLEIDMVSAFLANAD